MTDSTKPEEEVSEQISAEEYKLKGNECYKRGDYRGAIQFYDQAIEAAPTEPAYYGNRAAANFMLLKYDKVIEDCNLAIVMDPAFIKAYLRKAKAQQQLGNIEDAIDTYQKAAIRDPNNSAMLNEKKQAELALTKLARAKQLMTENKYREALLLLDSASQTAGESSSTKLLRVEALMGRERYDEAFSLVTKLMRLGTQTPELLYLRARCLYFQGDFQGAIRHLQQSLRSDPDNGKCMKEIKRIRSLESKKEAANTAFKAGRMQEAVDGYTECLSIDPSNKGFCAKLHSNRATALSKLKKYEEAIKDCDKAVYFDPSYAKAFLRKAACYRALGGEENIELALRAYDEASKLVSEDSQRDIQMNIRETKLELKKAKRKDYYKILGVGQNATDHEIKKAYRKSALKFHPDRHSSKTEEEQKEAEKQFKLIGEAYGVLSDPEKKQRYDSGVDLEDLEGGGSGFPGGMDASDIFSMFFGGGGMGGMGGHGHGGMPGGFGGFGGHGGSARYHYG